MSILKLCGKIRVKDSKNKFKVGVRTPDCNSGTKYWHNRVYVNQYNDFVDAKNLNFKFIKYAEHLNSNSPNIKLRMMHSE